MEEIKRTEEAEKNENFICSRDRVCNELCTSLQFSTVIYLFYSEAEKKASRMCKQGKKIDVYFAFDQINHCNHMA